MVEWAPLAVKERVSVWDAPGPAIRIMKGIKDRLDPAGHPQSRAASWEASEMAEQATVTEGSAAQGGLALHGHDVEGVNRCVHCGLCLAYCPTFSILGTEMDSPRGRIFLIKSLAEGRIALSDSTVRHLDLCLGCRACETVCPVRRAVRRADRGGARRGGAPAPGRPLAADLPLAQLRRAAPLPRHAVPGGGRPPLLPGERPSRLRARAPASSSSCRARCPRGSRCFPICPPLADRAPLPEITPAGGAEARAGRTSHRLHPARGLRPSQSRHRARPRQERRGGRGAAGPGMLRRAPRPQRRARDRGGPRDAAPSRPSRRRASITSW